MSETRRSLRLGFAWIAFAVFLATPGISLAQTNGALTGVVLDPAGDPLPGVLLALDGDALQRGRFDVVSDEAGRYRFAPIPAGVFTLTAELDGFARIVRENLHVGLHQEVRLDLTLASAEIREIVHVTGETVIDSGRTDLATRISPDELSALPLNGRNFEDLVPLVPGVRPLPEAERDQSFSIFGERPAATSFLVDGIDNNDPIDGGTLQRFNQDAIQEFEVLTSGYQAEFGRAQGGVVNVLTRSGTEDLRGSAFAFLRDDSFDSSNVPGQDAPALDREQWGLNLGGKVISERLYFFLSGENLDETRGRNIDLSTVPDWVGAGLATPDGVENFDAGPSTDGFAGLVKLDLLPGARHHLSFRSNTNRDEAAGELPTGIAGSLVLPSAARSREVDSDSFSARSTWTGADRFLETGLSWSDASIRDNLDRETRAEAVLLLFRGNFIQTGAPLGGSRRDVERLHVEQDFSLWRDTAAGGHHVKAGWDWLHTDLTGFNLVFNDVEYSAAFLDPNAVDINEDLFLRLGFAQSAARFFTLSGNPDGSLDLDLQNDDVGLFIQDSWRLGDWTFDFGLRWDRASLFGDDDDNFAPRLGVAWDVRGDGRTIVRANAGVFYDRNALLAASTVPEKGGVFTRNAFDVALPRLGFEYSASLIDIVITSGIPGVFPPENPAYASLADALREDPYALYDLLGIAVDDPSAPPVVTADNIASLSGRSAEEAIALLEETFPGTDWEFFDVPGGSIVGDRVLSFFPRGSLAQSRDVSVYNEDRTPKTEAVTVGVEQKLVGDWSLSLAWVHRRTEDLLTRRIINLFDAAPGDPNFAQTTDGGPRINAVTYDGRIDYDGYVVSVRRRLRDRWSLFASYTYSDAKDNLLTGEVGSRFSNNNRPELDWGPSNLSVPHLGVLSGTLILPWDARLSGNLFWRSGNAFSPRGIVDTDGDGLVDQRDLSVERNSFRVDDHVQLDLRLEKRFRFAGRHDLSVLIDAFNVTNEDNVAGVNAVAGEDFGAPNSFFPGREIQIGLRWAFGR